MPYTTQIGTVAIRVNVQYVVGCFCLGRFLPLYYQERSRTKVYFFSGKSWVLTNQAYICHNDERLEAGLNFPTVALLLFYPNVNL